MPYKKEELPTIKAVESIYLLTNNLLSRFNMNELSEDFLNKKISRSKTKHFEKIIASYRPFLSELFFITAGMNHKFSRVIEDAVKRLDEGGKTIISTGGTNHSFYQMIEEESKRIFGAIKRLQKDPTGYKAFVKKDKHSFDDSLFLQLAKTIQIDQSINVFINELDGGETALSIQKILQGEKDININLYGIDRDIDKGLESKRKDIHSARGGLIQVSKGWADISICSNSYFPFSRKETVETSELLDFYKMNVVRPGGLIIFNYPFYRLNDIGHILESNRLIAALNTKDKLGNLLFVIQTGNNESITKEQLETMQYSSGSLPVKMNEVFQYKNDTVLPVEKYRAKHIDFHDMISELNDGEDSAQFLIDYYATQTQAKNEQTPLIEYKPGHIPAIATSEVLNGRYVDEILKMKTGKSFQFDHLFATKIVKREAEEIEEQADENGDPLTLVKCKKHNFIISTALTAQGEYIELFSTEKVSDEEIV